MSIGPGVAMPARTTSPRPTPGLSISCDTDSGHAAAGIFRPFVLLGGHRVVGERLAGVVDKADLDVRAADVDADKEWLLSIFGANRRVGLGHGGMEDGQGCDSGRIRDKRRSLEYKCHSGNRQLSTANVANFELATRDHLAILPAIRWNRRPDETRFHALRRTIRAVARADSAPMAARTGRRPTRPKTRNRQPRAAMAAIAESRFSRLPP